MAIRKTPGILLFAWLVLFLVSGLLTISVYPPVNYNMADEIWAMKSSVAFVEGGMKGSTVEPRFYFWALGLFQKIMGEGVMKARAFSVIAATLVLYLTYVLGRELRDEWAGLLSSVLLGTTFAFAWHSRLIRNEMLTTAFVVGSVCLLCYALRKEKNWAVFAGGLLAALSVNVHPNNLQYAIAVIPVFAVIFRKKAASASALYLLGGLVAGAVLWLFISYFPSVPEGGRPSGPMAGVAAVYPFPVLNENFFALFWRSLKRWPGDYLQYSRLFDVFYPVRISFAVLGLGALFVWGASVFTPERRRVLSIVGLVALTNFIIYFITKKYGFWHMVELYPFLCVAAALSLFGIKDRLPKKAGVAAFVAGALFLAGVGLADTAMAYSRMKGYDYNEFIARVTAKIDGRAMGMDLYAPAFEAGDFVGPWFDTDKPSGQCPSFAKKVKDLGIEYIIVDDVLRSVSRRACGLQYEEQMLKYVEQRWEPVDWAPVMYPSYWAPGEMISEIYVFRAPAD